MCVCVCMCVTEWGFTTIFLLLVDIKNIFINTIKKLCNVNLHHDAIIQIFHLKEVNQVHTGSAEFYIGLHDILHAIVMRISSVKTVLWLAVNLHHLFSNGAAFNTQSRRSHAKYRAALVL